MLTPPRPSQPSTTTTTTKYDNLAEACPHLGKIDAAGGADKVVHHPVVVDDVELESDGVEADGFGDAER